MPISGSIGGNCPCCERDFQRKLKLVLLHGAITCPSSLTDFTGGKPCNFGSKPVDEQGFYEAYVTPSGEERFKAQARAAEEKRTIFRQS